MKFDRRLFTGAALLAALSGEARAESAHAPENTVEQRAYRVVDMSRAHLNAGLPEDYYTGEGFFAQEFLAGDDQNTAREMFQLVLQKSENLNVPLEKIEEVQGKDGKIYLYYEVKQSPSREEGIPTS
ncbi:MAG: hypothetical protein COV59_01335 [Candidatus Magasanikbacteria bacterium CG11_big_fil_rev_8_21_14_0_20_39_34]|uniref:Uncharacterized protein n=1 Tax=Candidatus Magasanikbacteria bacterium CG11_big_fil_rev_8_21_14_0_20_39_34 TaxID=1974653 RepID=A0A2H0N8A0_9BACT|nr:MAG: hypothetical protein COV59_01335 [Candidatus Magasanikbacteria bacterium CG11_big_fil_rev_8_21_14_0_20_39_34]